jgi:hypothetical protein
MPSVLARAEKEKADTGKEVTRYTRIAERWWQFYDYRPGTIAAINSVPRYVAVSRVTKRPIFEFVSNAIHSDTAIVLFPLPDDYSFGILQSGIHFEWFKARCSTLESRFRYTSDTVFDTFPWPQAPTRAQIEAVANAAVALRQLRRDVMAKMNWSLRDLYRTLEEPGANPLRDAQARLDEAVRAAYGMPHLRNVQGEQGSSSKGPWASSPLGLGSGQDAHAPGSSGQDAHAPGSSGQDAHGPLPCNLPPADPLAFLLALNQACATREAAGEPITPPGLPLPANEHAAFITDDCIQVANPEPA